MADKNVRDAAVDSVPRHDQKEKIYFFFHISSFHHICSKRAFVTNGRFQKPATFHEFEHKTKESADSFVNIGFV